MWTINDVRALTRSYSVDSGDQYVSYLFPILRVYIQTGIDIYPQDMYPTQNVIDGPHCTFNELWMMDRKESPSIVIITEKGNDERHFPPAFFPFFFSNFDNSRAIVRPSGGGGGGKWRGARRHGDATAQRWYGGEMARVGARWYGTYLSLSRGAARRLRRRPAMNFKILRH